MVDPHWIAPTIAIVCPGTSLDRPWLMSSHVPFPESRLADVVVSAATLPLAFSKTRNTGDSKDGKGSIEDKAAIKDAELGATIKFKIFVEPL